MQTRRPRPSRGPLGSRNRGQLETSVTFQHCENVTGRVRQLQKVVQVFRSVVRLQLTWWRCSKLERLSLQSLCHWLRSERCSCCSEETAEVRRTQMCDRDADIIEDHKNRGTHSARPNSHQSLRCERMWDITFASRMLCSNKNGVDR